MTSVLQIIAGPVFGIIIVVFAYCFGIYLSLKCCRPEENEIDEPTSSRLAAHRDILDPGHIHGVDIFIVSRSQDYLVPVHRPRLIISTSTSQHAEIITPSSSPAPEYEEPPTYEDCVEKGFANY